MLQPLGAGDRRHRLGLGPGVELHDRFSPHPVDEGLLQPGRAGRGQVPERFQRGEVVFGARFLRQMPDPVHHGRDQIDPARLVLLDGRQGRLGLEAGQQHHVRALAEGRHHHAEAGVMVERRRQQGDGVLLQPPAADLGDVLRADPRLPCQDQLGPSGRAAAGRGFRNRGGDVGQVAVVVRQGQQVGDRQQRAVDLVIELRDHHRRLGQLHDRFQFTLRQAERDRLRRRADLPHGPAGDGEIGRIRQAQRH